MNSYNILADTSDQEEHYEVQELFVRWEPSSGPLALLHSNNVVRMKSCVFLLLSLSLQTPVLTSPARACHSSHLP